MNAWVGAIPVSGEIQEWLQSLVVRLNWLNEFSQRKKGSRSQIAVGIHGVRHDYNCNCMLNQWSNAKPMI